MPIHPAYSESPLNHLCETCSFQSMVLYHDVYTKLQQEGATAYKLQVL